MELYWEWETVYEDHILQNLSLCTGHVWLSGQHKKVVVNQLLLSKGRQYFCLLYFCTSSCVVASTKIIAAEFSYITPIIMLVCVISWVYFLWLVFIAPEFQLTQNLNLIFIEDRRLCFCSWSKWQLWVCIMWMDSDTALL